MRVLVGAPPKTGNVWVERLFSLAFGLTWIRQAPTYDYWGTRDLAGLQQFIDAGHFPSSSIVHQHFWPSRALDEIARGHGIHLVTTIRDPYDQFVSWYFYIQSFADDFVAARDPGQRAIGKPIDHPDVLDLPANEFGAFLDQAVEWLASGTSLVIRYETLHRDSPGVLAEGSRYLGVPLTIPADEAIRGATAERMREDGTPEMVRHVRAARVGDSRAHLTDAHSRLFRLRHTSRIERLGYAVQ